MRIDRRSPAFADRINLQAVAFIFYNVCRRLALCAPFRKVGRLWLRASTVVVIARKNVRANGASEAPGGRVPSHHLSGSAYRIGPL